MRDGGVLGSPGLVDIGRDEEPISVFSEGLKLLRKSCCDFELPNDPEGGLLAGCKGHLGGVLLAASAITVLISTLQKGLC